jgi:RNA polymerase sigma-70 factor (ECF subfamily)
MSSQTDMLLVRRIRSAEPEAWKELIARFEGRLLAFVEHRVRDRATAEDVVQETFLGFLTSLPNYDERRSLEGYLFSIAAHKLTDRLRREGRRPVLPLLPEGESSSSGEPPGAARGASSILRSGERRDLEESALAAALGQIIDRWRWRGEWQKLQMAELLFVRGWPNKEVASRLGVSEQAVANQKFEFLAQLRAAIKKQRLPEDVFPELYEDGSKEIKSTARNTKSETNSGSSD